MTSVHYIKAIKEGAAAPCPVVFRRMLAAVVNTIEDKSKVIGHEPWLSFYCRHESNGGFATIIRVVGDHDLGPHQIQWSGKLSFEDVKWQAISSDKDLPDLVRP